MGYECIDVHILTDLLSCYPIEFFFSYFLITVVKYRFATSKKKKKIQVCNKAPNIVIFTYHWPVEC